MKATNSPGPRLTKGMARHLNLPWAPPPSVKDVFTDGAQAYYDWLEDCMSEALILSGDPAEYPECPWPIYSDEGRAWFKGWNSECDIDNER